MNTDYISAELKRKRVPFDFFMTQAGMAIKVPFFIGHELNMFCALLPIGDEEDAEFVEFVAEKHRVLNYGTVDEKISAIIQLEKDYLGGGNEKA